MSSEIQGTIMRLISAPIMDDSKDPPSDCTHAQNYILEAVNAERQLWKLINLKGILHIDVQKLYRKARSTYEKIMLTDPELAELQDIEYSLWKLHYKHIDEYRNKIRGSSVAKEHMNATTAQHVITVQHKSDHYLEGFKSFLSEATEFYHHLVKKIRRSYGISEELCFSNEGGSLSSMDSSKWHRCQFLCHRCLVCLGDLARYRELYGNPDGQICSWSLAATHYLNASSVWPDSGNPHNQLAVLAIYVGDELLALYHCIRSLAVKEPFPDAWDNLILLFEKNRSSHLHSLSNSTTFNFLKPSERSTVQVRMQTRDSFSKFQSREANEDYLAGETMLWSLIVRMMSYFYVKPSLEDFPCIFGSTITELESLLSLDDSELLVALESYQHMDVARTGPFRILQLVSVLIFTIHTLSGSSQLEKAKYVKYMQQPSLLQQAFNTTFIFMGRLVKRCMIANPMHSSSLLPGILVFVEWLVDMFETVEKYATDEQCSRAISYFFDAFVDLLNQFDEEANEIDSQDFSILWEDKELEGFSPISQFHGPSDVKGHQEMRNRSDDINECEVRIRRVVVAAVKIVNKSIGSRKWIYHGKSERKFFTSESTKKSGRRELVTARLDLKVRESPQYLHISKDVPPLQEDVKACQLPEQSGKNVHKGVPVEEEEVILFNPITRHNSAPLYLPLTRNQVPSEGDSNVATSSGGCSHSELSLHFHKKEVFTDPDTINRCSNITGSSNKTLWDEPIPEDSVVDSFVDSFVEPTDSPRFKALSAKSNDLPALAGPPSLSAWVGNQDTRMLAEGKGLKEASKHNSGGAEDSASAHVNLSIGGNEVSQQDVKITPAPASSSTHGSTNNGDPVSRRNSSAYSFYKEPPYMPPAPSAPLLPDDATWFTGKSSNSTENEKTEDTTGFFPIATQVNNYSSSARTQCHPNFNPNLPWFIDGYALHPGQAGSAQWPHHYPVIPEQAYDNILPGQFYTPAALVRFQNDVISNSPYDDYRTKPSVSHLTKNLEDLSFYPGYINPAEGQKKEGHFAAYSGLGPSQSPYGYGAVKDLRSEQQLLLKYLKEKERHLQQEAQLRGSA